MITRHHLALALICGLILGGALAGFNPLILVVILAGTGIGAILPDIHMKRPKKTCLLTVAWCIVLAGRRVCIPVICGIYRLVPGIRVRSDDKRLTHSVPGILLYFILLAGIARTVVILSGDCIPALPVMAFLEGLLMGLVFHFAEDLCTRKGIAVFFPFTTTGIHGSIRPCDIYDNRIPRFHIQHGSILIVFLLLMWAEPALAEYLVPLGLLGTGTCIVSMVCQSEVRIDHGTGQESTSPDATMA